MKKGLNYLVFAIIALAIVFGCKKDEKSSPIEGKWELYKINGSVTTDNVYLNVTSSKIYYYEDWDECYSLEIDNYTITGDEICTDGDDCVEFEIIDNMLYVYAEYDMIFKKSTVDLGALEVCEEEAISAIKGFSKLNR